MSQDVGAGGYHWQTESHVARWKEAQARIAPQRAIAFEAMLAQLTPNIVEPLRIADLGAGDGKVAATILERYPAATAELFDFSDLMMAKGSEALLPFVGRYRYHFWDMNVSGWPAGLDGPYDAVVSSAAIHHLENPRKRWLAGEILGRLRPDGIFANYELFRSPTSEFAESEVHDRTAATLAEYLEFLNAAGFARTLVTARGPRRDGRTEVALVVAWAPGPDAGS